MVRRPIMRWIGLTCLVTGIAAIAYGGLHAAIGARFDAEPSLAGLPAELIIGFGLGAMGLCVGVLLLVKSETP